MTQTIRCRAPRKGATATADLCGGFVARLHVPDGSYLRFVGLVKHSQRAAADSQVVACSVCGRLQELEVASATYFKRASGE